MDIERFFYTLEPPCIRDSSIALSYLSWHDAAHIEWPEYHCLNVPSVRPVYY